jgi:hypothetical protein
LVVVVERPCEGIASASAPLYMANLAGGTGSHLIELMPLWPCDAGIQDFVFRFCNPWGAAVDAVYQHCDVPRWRRLLLENVYGSPGYWYFGDARARILELARRDTDPECRELAYRDVGLRAIRLSIFLEAIRGNDLVALHGLAKNRSLSRRQLLAVRNRLQELGDDYGVSEASRTIAVIRARDPWKTQTIQSEFEIKEVESTRTLESRENMFLGATLREYWILTVTGVVLGLIAYLSTERIEMVLLVAIVTIWATLGRTLHLYRAASKMSRVKEKDDMSTENFADNGVQEWPELGGKVTTETIDQAKEQERIASYKAVLEESRRKDQLVSASSKRDSFFKRVLDRLMRLLYT